MVKKRNSCPPFGNRTRYFRYMEENRSAALERKAWLRFKMDGTRPLRLLFFMYITYQTSFTLCIGQDSNLRLYCAFATKLPMRKRSDIRIQHRHKSIIQINT